MSGLILDINNSTIQAETGNLTLGDVDLSTNTISNFTSTGIDDNATATAVTIDSSEQVGINKTSPGARLHIEDTTGAGGGVIKLTVDTSGTADNFGRIHFGNATDSNLAQIWATADGAADAGFLAFSTEATGGALTERMRITSAGLVGIGITPVDDLHIGGAGTKQLRLTNSTIGETSGDGLYFQMHTNGNCEIINNEAGLMKFGSSGSSYFEIESGGASRPGADNAYTMGTSGRRFTDIYATSGSVNTSDEREKTEIQDSDLGLNFVLSLRPVSYKWITAKNEVVSFSKEERRTFRDNNQDVPNNGVKEIISVPGKRTHYGFLSQQVKESVGYKDFGGWTLDDPNDPESRQGLRYHELIAPMVKAIQELEARIKQLEEGN